MSEKNPGGGAPEGSWEIPSYQVLTDKNQKVLSHFFIPGKSLALPEVFRKFSSSVVMAAICSTTRSIVLGLVGGSYYRIVREEPDL